MPAYNTAALTVLTRLQPRSPTQHTHFCSLYCPLRLSALLFCPCRICCAAAGLTPQLIPVSQQLGHKTITALVLAQNLVGCMIGMKKGVGRLQQQQLEAHCRHAQWLFAVLLPPFGR
jgi:hypothetical protein